jgi:hypothetical protein
MNNSLDPSSNNMALQLDQIEITDEGILVINDSEKYIKIVRDLSPGANVSMLEAKQNNSSKPTLQISNVSVNNYNNEGIALNIPDGGVNIAERLWVQGMALDPVSPGTNYAVKAIWQAGQRKGELFGSTSTRRNKKDISDWNFNVLDKIKLVNVKEFRYKHWPDTTELTLGMIAEDLRDAGFAYAPMYDFDENGEKTNEVSGIDWENVSVILWKGLQELNARVESLENK